jgi:tetratricopeptide (TPR) repeat protein
MGAPSGVFFCLRLGDQEWSVSKRAQFRLEIFCSLFLCTAAATAQNNLDQQFQSALAQYNAGHFAAAAAQLEDLLSRVPKSFEVHELLGLAYASQSQDTKAIEQLQVASGLKPGDFDANHNLGELYIKKGKIAEATPFLEKAQRINPSSYGNGYDLALAYSLTGRIEQARQLVQTLLRQKNTGELHNLLAQIEEKDAKYLVAESEFSTAAHMDPSEANLFDWGSEFLLHRTYEPAIEVFERATQRYPNSPRLMIGLGMALSARGKYEEAIQPLLKAADLDPADPRCYRFLSHAYDVSPNPSLDVVERFRGYSELQPGNAMAQFYYAMSLLKGKTPEVSSPEFHQVESLLQKSIALDGTFAESHFRLGNLYADQHDYAKSFPEYERAVQLNPNLPDAHYRLGQYYVHAGRKDLAQPEFAAYQRLRAEYLAQLDKEGNEVQQFVSAAKAAPVNKP